MNQDTGLQLTTLCQACQIGEAGGCFVYPLETTSCREFRPYVHAYRASGLLMLSGLSAAKSVDGRRAHVRALNNLLERWIA